jgi:hypothetical protein
MIGLALWLILGLYVGLLVLAWKKVETGPARIVVLTILLSPVIWVIGESSVGHYKFKQACKSEAGLKVYIENPPQAKRLRLEGNDFFAVDAEGTLERYPSLRQVEAQDRKFNYVTPPAYAVYERGSDGKVVSVLMDKVGRLGGVGETKLLESAPLQAEYILSHSFENLPNRLHKRQFALRRADGRLVATTTHLGYSDTDPKYSLLAMPWGRSEGCGPNERETEILINLIASNK